MDNIYISYTFKINPKEPATEILVAELGEVGFESFVENEEGVIAYIQQVDWNENLLDDIFVLNSEEFSISYEMEVIEQIFRTLASELEKRGQMTGIIAELTGDILKEIRNEGWIFYRISLSVIASFMATPYQVIARKWRPQTFDDVVGQDHVPGLLGDLGAGDAHGDADLGLPQ